MGFVTVMSYYGRATTAFGRPSRRLAIGRTRATGRLTTVNAGAGQLSSGEGRMETTGFLFLIRRYWWALVLGAVVGALAAHTLASRMSPTYEASVSLLTGPINATYDTQRAAGSLGRTYASLATSGPLLRRAIAVAHAKTTAEELKPDVSAVSNDVTRIVNIRVRNGDRDVAARLANALAQQLIRLGGGNNAAVINAFMLTPAIAALDATHKDEVRAAATSLIGAYAPGKLRIIDPADPPPTAVAPRVSLITLMGLFAGLLAAGLATIVRASTSRGIESEDSVTEEDVRLLGALPGGRGSRRVAVDDGKALPAAYEVISAKIGFSANGKPIQTVLVIGASEGAGSGVVAANVAAAFAAGNRRVTLVDAGSPGGEITKS